MYYRHRQGFDASQIAGNLYQGSAPPAGPELRARGFSVLVLCAEEIQPDAWMFPGVRVIHAPMDDGAYVPVQTAHAAAREVARALAAGAKVLVTCAMGLNRSGLVTALALWYASGTAGAACVARVQKQRANALCNQVFADHVVALPPRATRVARKRARQDSVSW